MMKEKKIKMKLQNDDNDDDDDEDNDEDDDVDDDDVGSGKGGRAESSRKGRRGMNERRNGIEGEKAGKNGEGGGGKKRKNWTLMRKMSGNTTGGCQVRVCIRAKSGRRQLQQWVKVNDESGQKKKFFILCPAFTPNRRNRIMTDHVCECVCV